MSRPVPLPRTAFVRWHGITLRWVDNDVYGHVNNTIYYQWFDTAVNAMLVSEGLLDIASGDPICLVAGTSCDYFSPISFPGAVEVGLAVEELGRSSVKYRLGVFPRGAEEAAATGRFVHVAVSRSERRPISWPAAWRAVLDTLVVSEPARLSNA